MPKLQHVAILFLTRSSFQLPLSLLVPLQVSVRAFSSSSSCSDHNVLARTGSSRWLLPGGTKTAASSRSFAHVTHQPQLFDRARESGFRLCSTTSHDNTNAGTDANNDIADTDIDKHDWEGDDSGLADEEEEMDDEEMDDDDDDDQVSQEYQLWLKAIDKAQKALSKKQTSLENEASKAQKIEGTVARAQLIVNNIYLFNTDNNKGNHNKEQIYTVVDWDNDGQEIELTLDTRNFESPSAEADALFAQARKLKRGSQVIQGLLEEVQQAVQVLTDCQADLSGADPNDEGRLRLVQDRLRRTASSTKFQEPSDSSTTKNNKNSSKRQPSNQPNHKKKAGLGTPASNVRKLVTPNGATVLVGRNRRDNEYLSLTQARGNDVWMHARGTPGAHVLLLDRRGSVRPTDDCLAFAADLAAFYSDGRTEVKVPVTVAEPKHVVKPRGAPLGAVKLRQEGEVLYGCPDGVPEELHQARAQSGVYATEEYRSADKAKHRKRTQQVQKQKQKQKREQQKKKRRSHYETGDDPYA